MALSAGLVLELRTTAGANQGGGFYDRVPGTSVDYTQQDTAQLSLTDLVSDVAGTTITSVTGGFTDAMVGNVIYIESTGGFTAGFYEIIAYTDTNTITIDRTAGESKTGGAGKVGGALDYAAFAAYIVTGTDRAQGDKIWIKAGTYVMTANVTHVENQIHTWEGYNTTRGDNPTGANRPKFDGITNTVYFTTGAYFSCKHVQFESDATYGFQQDNYQFFMNCSFSNAVGWGSYRVGPSFNRHQFYINCEFIGGDPANTGNRGLNIGISGRAENALIAFCKFTDLNRGLHTQNTSMGVILSCLFERIYEWAIYNVLSGSTFFDVITHCTFFACGKGISCHQPNSIISNNIFRGIDDYVIRKNDKVTDDATRTAIIRRNCFRNVLYPVARNQFELDISGGNIGIDPEFNNLPGGDYSLDSASPLIDAGDAILLGVTSP